MKKRYKYNGWSLWNFSDAVAAPIARIQVLVETLQVSLAGTAFFTDNTRAGIAIVIAAWAIKFVLQGICLEEIEEN